MSEAVCQTLTQQMRGKSGWPRAWQRWRVIAHKPGWLKQKESLIMADMDDDELLAALGVDVTPLQVSSRTPREERIIAGFEDILRFYHTHGRAPLHGEDRDIFERLYAVRLDLRKLPEAPALLSGLDSAGLLSGAMVQLDVDALDEDALLAELGIDDVAPAPNDITVLRHVRPLR